MILVAICQIFVLDGDRLGNFVRIENAIREACEQKAEIVCFPETSIYGWVNVDAHNRAYSIPGKDSDLLCELAKKYKIYLCIGLAEKEDEKLYDTALLIDDQGTILLKHRKMNILSELMKPSYTPGQDVHAVDTRFGKIGVLICADTFVKENLERMKKLRPDLLLVPYGWAAEEEAWPEHGKKLLETVTKAARSVGVPVVGTDAIGEISHGPWKGRVYGGQSVAADREGHVIAVLKDRDREIRVVKIDLHKE